MIDRSVIKAAAVKMAKESGLINLSRKALCDEVGIPDGSFPHIMGYNFSDLIEELKLEVKDSKIHVVSKGRTDPALRRDHILDAAIELAKRSSYDKITRDAVADRAGISVALVSRYFGTMPQLKRAIMWAAVTREVPEIIAQGLAQKDKHAAKAPEGLKSRAVALLAS